MTRLRNESLQPPACPSNTTRATVASVGIVVERPFERFVVGQVLKRGLRRAGDRR